MIRVLSLSLLALGAALGACAASEYAPASSVAPLPREPRDEQARSEERSLEPAQPAAETERTKGPSRDLPPLPPAIRVGRVETFPIPNDRSVRLAHAGREQPRAIVYLHGMCSDTSAAEPWFPEATKYGTVVALRADVPCDDRPGFKWPKDPELLEARIARVLERVKEERGGLLDLEHPALIGYSQGAHRAELLSAAFPGRYRRLVLGGPPEAALAEHFTKVERVAFLGGEKEDTTHMVRGAKNLEDARIETRFFLLPRAPHGSFGPRGNEVMRGVLEWVFDETR